MINNLNQPKSSIIGVDVNTDTLNSPQNIQSIVKLVTQNPDFLKSEAFKNFCSNNNINRDIKSVKALLPSNNQAFMDFLDVLENEIETDEISELVNQIKCKN